ncbi:ATP-binding cassette, subfamily C, CydC [Austwickia chelonae]|uniref:ABC transporter permease/ATP-binding protein CydC n=1 Tax=Austwickia chelonae NBRC 105200 TaxID=1184607 RepID=K6W9X8_9MICO|nr:thiol reductant ABC exporter subunit CydC [Austwickia chelonae]GAB78637.1 ABC transporter permease/ATP-binding protein CydC [Austwickia chelonae NBRC 105200]SEW34283.1 ATP-binding cassette, subfamily C, CydC [Austwickia chelonae]
MSPVPSPSARRFRPVPGVLPAAFVGGLALTCGVALTATSGWLIVAASYQPQILTLLAAIVLVRAFGIARPALRYVERIRSHDAALSFLAEERARVYGRLIPLTPARLGRRSRGEVLAGAVDDLDDIAYAQVRVVVPLVALVVSGVLAAMANAVILFSAALVTLSALVWALLVGGVNYRMEKRAHQEVVAARAEVSRVSTVIAAQGTELAAIGAQAQALSWLGSAQASLSAALRRQARGRAFGVAAMPLVTVVHTVAMVALVAPWTHLGLRTPLAAFLVLTPVALGEVVSGVPDAVGALARAQSARSRLDALVNQVPAVRDSEGAGSSEAETGPASTSGASAASEGVPVREEPGRPPRLSTDRVTASWDGERPALSALSTDIVPGSRVAVVGPNGSGKSTFLAVLARHLDPTSGVYRVDGTEVSRLSLAEARSRIAVVDDEAHVFASNLRENIRFARPGCADGDIEQSLRLAGLGPWYEGLPDGLDTRLGVDGQGVSGGERARLGIARALLSRRPVLLLDEPVAHVDHPTAVAVMRDLREASTGRTVVLVSHRAEGVEEGDVVVDLEVVRTPPPVSGPR